MLRMLRHLETRVYHPPLPLFGRAEVFCVLADGIIAYHPAECAFGDLDELQVWERVFHRLLVGSTYIIVEEFLGRRNGGNSIALRG
jgi:hypothetical protein